MIIDSKFSKSFISDSLSTTKLNELKEFALLIKNHKNIVSQEVNSNISFYMEMPFFEFLKFMRSKYYGLINSNFDKQLYQDVFICYQNKFEAIQKNIAFEKITFNGFEFYKRNSKNNKVGDFKKVNLKREKTKLSVVLSYLSRYGSESTIEYIDNQLKRSDLEQSKINLYNNVLNYADKFGFDRLLSLSLQRRNRVIKHYSRHPIEFKKLTFRGRSRLKQDIISYNNNFNSKIKAFINISWLERGSKLAIPIKYCKHYHGEMSDYRKNTNDVEYLISFDRDKIKVNICKDGQRFIPENKTNYIGIDVNVKHNLFALSDSTNFDYNRKLLNDLSNELLKIDNLKKDKSYVVGKKK